MKKLKIQSRPFGPFPAAIVGATVQGKPNYAAVGAYGVVSLKPVLYVSLKSTHYTTEGVKENGYFSINIPSADLVEKTDYCGMVSGRNTDKSQLFEAFYDELGNAPMIEECNLNYLCKVIQVIPMFDFEMFLGEIVAVYVNEQCLTDGRPELLEIKPMTMLDGKYFDTGKAVGNAFKVGMSIKDK